MEYIGKLPSFPAIGRYTAPSSLSILVIITIDTGSGISSAFLIIKLLSSSLIEAASLPSIPFDSRISSANRTYFHKYIGFIGVGIA